MQSKHEFTLGVKNKRQGQNFKRQRKKRQKIMCERELPLRRQTKNQGYT